MKERMIPVPAVLLECLIENSELLLRDAGELAGNIIRREIRQAKALLAEWGEE